MPPCTRTRTSKGLYYASPAPPRAPKAVEATQTSAGEEEPRSSPSSTVLNALVVRNARFDAARRLHDLISSALHLAQVLSQHTMLMVFRDVGLHVWETRSIIQAGKRGYFLITAPLSVLASRAEMLRMKVRVNAMPSQQQAHMGGGNEPRMFQVPWTASSCNGIR